MLKLPATAELSCDVALLAAETEGGPRKFRIDPAYTGGPVNLKGWPLPLVIDLATLTKAKRVIANMEHDRGEKVGHGTEYDNDGKRIILGGVVSAASAASRQFVEASDAGFPWGGSVEVAFKPSNVTELAPGKTAKMNGRTVTGPLLLGRKGLLFGVAMTDHPADDSTEVTIAASAGDKLTLRDLRTLANLTGRSPAKTREA